MSFTHKKLEWDSRFFNLKIIAAHQQLPADDDLFMLAQLMEQEDVDLTYFFTKVPLQSGSPIGFDLIFADQKATYNKMVGDVPGADPNITAYSLAEPNADLQMLAIESGHISRFNNDPNFSRQQFESLYKSWLEQSINKVIADEVLLYLQDKQPIGLITLSGRKGKGNIGLLSVDRRHRNKGIGKALLHAAENWFMQQGLSQAEVVTQLANTPACRLYERLGYRLKELENVYHLWQSKPGVSGKLTL